MTGNQTEKHNWTVTCWNCKKTKEYKGNFLPLADSCIHCSVLFEIMWNSQDLTGATVFIEKPVDEEGKAKNSAKGDCPGCDYTLTISCEKLTAYCCNCNENYYRDFRDESKILFVEDRPTLANAYKKETAEDLLKEIDYTPKPDKTFTVANEEVSEEEETHRPMALILKDFRKITRELADHPGSSGVRFKEFSESSLFYGGFQKIKFKGEFKL